MKIAIITDGHQHYSRKAGEVLQWAQTVEYFDGKPMQVPCVVILTDEGAIECVPLKTQYTWTLLSEAEE